MYIMFIIGTGVIIIINTKVDGTLVLNITNHKEPYYYHCGHLYNLLPVMAIVLSDVILQTVTWSSCPCSRCMTSPSSRSHTKTRLSEPPDTAYLLLGLISPHKTPPSCPTRTCSEKVDQFDTLSSMNLNHLLDISDIFFLNVIRITKLKDFLHKYGFLQNYNSIYRPGLVWHYQIPVLSVTCPVSQSRNILSWMKMPQN